MRTSFMDLQGGCNILLKVRREKRRSYGIRKIERKDVLSGGSADGEKVWYRKMSFLLDLNNPVYNIFFYWRKIVDYINDLGTEIVRIIMRFVYVIKIC